MTLYLKKSTVEIEGEINIVVECRNTTGEIPRNYSFPDGTSDADMEGHIVPDLTDKGYTELDPVEWET